MTANQVFRVVLGIGRQVDRSMGRRSRRRRRRHSVGGDG